MPTKVTTKKPARKAAPKACQPKKMNPAEEAAFMASLDEQTRDIVKRIQRLKRVL
jgi:hypothetical protein